jgi:hypothetical protein
LLQALTTTAGRFGHAHSGAVPSSPSGTATRERVGDPAAVDTPRVVGIRRFDRSASRPPRTGSPGCEWTRLLDAREWDALVSAPEQTARAQRFGCRL